MARIHARKKGKSSSSRPYRVEAPEWSTFKSKEVERLVIKFSDEGLSSSQIGMKLRDQFGIPNIKLVTKKSVMKILTENKRDPKLPEDIRNLMKKAVNLGEHLEENPKDIHNKRALALTEAKIRRLMKYYKRQGTLPPEWIYNLKSAKLLVE